MILNFGKKYRGEDVEDVPDDYLLWIYENCDPQGELLEYLKENIDAIRYNVKQSKKEEDDD